MRYYRLELHDTYKTPTAAEREHQARLDRVFQIHNQINEIQRLLHRNPHYRLQLSALKTELKHLYKVL